MERSALGRTGIEATRICIGCWQAAGWESSDDERFVATVRAGLDRGLNFIDTAVLYGNGHSEELVGRAVEGRRHQVVIATKFAQQMSRPKDVRASLDASLRRLKTDYVDLLQQHWPPPDVPLADTIGELERLKQEGKTRAIGVSNWMEPEWEELDDPSRVDCLQPDYSLLWRSVERNVLPMCRKHDIAVITYSSLCQGILAGKFRDIDHIPQDCRRRNVRLKPDAWPEVLKVLRVLREVATKYGKTMAQAAVRWLLDQEGVTAAIVGASRPEQLEENLGALDWHLDPADCERLADVSWPLSENLKPHDSLWSFHPRER
jgi:aryl-alcohol dehydrogenase-like predicted oxidoreductase